MDVSQGCLTSPDQLAPSRAADHWYKRAVIYELHVRAFSDSDGSGSGDFTGLIGKLDYIQDLGVTAIWLLPFCPSPGKDDGYDISDYTGIHEAYGCLDDFRRFLDECKKRGLRVITELVLNHTSDQHPWFQRARQSPPGSRWRDYYVWSDDPEKYRDVRIIFKDFETSNWTWDPVAQAWYWHRFYSHQPDLNFDSPDVRREILEALDFWFGLGVDGLRLDAVPYLFEREGTTCENLPETHAFLRELRRHVDAHYEGRMLLAEANQWPEDALAYFGCGDECHMAFNFPLMPRLFMATRMEDSFPITNIVQRLPALPEGCAWAIFLRNHDELTLEMVCEEERDYMYRSYAEDPAMRINLGIRRRLAPLAGNDERRIRLMHALLFSLPGTPVIYYGDEIGMGEDLSLGDRNSVRTPMQWSGALNGGFSAASPDRLYLPVVADGEYACQFLNVEAQLANTNSLLWWMRHALTLRRGSEALTDGKIGFLSHGNRQVLAFVRRCETEDVLVVANLSRFAQPAELPLGAYAGRTPVEAFGRVEFPVVTGDPYRLSLTPYGFFWFVLQKPDHAPLKAVYNFSFEWQSRNELARALKPHLMDAIARAGRRITAVDVIDLIRFSDNAAIAIVEVSLSAGDPEFLLLPLTVRSANAGDTNPNRIVARLTAEGEPERLLCIDAADAVMSDTLLHLISASTELQMEAGWLRGAAGSLFIGTGEAKHLCLLPDAFDDEQRNTSVLLSDVYVLKLFRRLEPGGNPDVRTVRYLFEDAGFTHVAPVFGKLEYVRSDGVAFDAGVLHAFVDSSRDLWKMALNELSLHLECAATECTRRPDKTLDETQPFTEVCRLLGRRTAEMHRALAGPAGSDFEPEPFSTFDVRGLCHSMSSRAALVTELLRSCLPDLPPATRDDAAAALDALGSMDERFAQLTAIADHGARVRVHGDLHLGQVLHTGADIVFIDFEGDNSRPLFERLIKASPLVDVAGIVHSLRYAASSAMFNEVAGAFAWRGRAAELRDELDLWTTKAAGAFFHAYREHMAGADLVPRSEAEFDACLRIYLLAKAVYQVGYELEHRHRWSPVALRTLRNLGRL